MHDYFALAAEVFAGSYMILSAVGNLLTRVKNPKAKAFGQRLVQISLEIKTLEEAIENKE